MMRAMICAIGALSASGCYQYVPVGDAVPERGSDITVHLEPRQDIGLGPVMIRDVETINGFVARATPDSVVVSSVWLYSLLGHRYGTNGDVYYFRRDGDLAQMEVRQLHPARTVVAVVGGTAVALGIFGFVADVGSDAGGDPGKGNVNPNVVAPVVR